MTQTEVKELQCPTCEGLGTVEAEGHLDTDSIEAVRNELVSIVTSTDERYSLVSDSRALRVEMAARISWLASRLNWLESIQMMRDEWSAKFAAAAAEDREKVDAAVARSLAETAF